MEKDLSTVKEILEKASPELKAEIEHLKQDNILRLGKKRFDNSDMTKKHRPIRVTLPDEDFKNEILKNSKNIRNSQNNSKVYIKKT